MFLAMLLMSVLFISFLMTVLYLEETNVIYDEEAFELICLQAFRVVA